MSSLHSDGSLPLNEDALGEISQRLSAALFSSLPQLREYARMQKPGESDGLSLVVTIPSPTNDANRLCIIWVDEVATPSIGFGPSHTHENNDDDGVALIVDKAAAILGDELLIIEDIGGKYPGHGSWVDLRDPDALEEELTSPYSPGSALLKSWSGKADRQVSTASLTR